LDFKTIIDLHKKSLYRKIPKIKRFLSRYNIKESKMIIEFLKLSNLITIDDIQSLSKDKLNLAILFLTLNHLQFYGNSPNYMISMDDFVIKYSKEKLTKVELKLFLQKIIEEKVCIISFYELKLKKRSINLYFRANDKCGMIFESVIQTILRDMLYIECLNSRKFNKIVLNELCEEILQVLIDDYKIFPNTLENSLYTLTEHHILNLIKESKKKITLNWFELNDIPEIILMYDFLVFKRLDYLQKKALLFLEEADEMLPPFEFHEKINAALGYIDKLISHYPKESLNYIIKSKILNYVGKHEEALKIIMEAINLNSGTSFYYSNLANILSGMNEYGQALEAIEKAIELEPENPEYYSDLSQILLFLNQLDKAIKAVDIAIKLAPKNIKFYIQKSNFLAYWMKEYKWALKTIEKAFDLNPTATSLFELYKHKVGIYLSMKDRKNALDIAEIARERFPHKEIFPNLK
jgi:tetratricopeptide (TPR) repeat protein